MSSTVWLVIMLVFILSDFVIMGCLSHFGNNMKRPMFELALTTLMLIFTIAGGYSAFKGLSVCRKENLAETTAQVQEIKENGYTVYWNGQSVSIDSVNLDGHEITLDSENGRAFVE